MRLALSSSITEISTSGKAFFSPSISRIMFKEVMPYMCMHMDMCMCMCM